MKKSTRMILDEQWRTFSSEEKQEFESNTGIRWCRASIEQRLAALTVYSGYLQRQENLRDIRDLIDHTASHLERIADKETDKITRSMYDTANQITGNINGAVTRLGNTMQEIAARREQFDFAIEEARAEVNKRLIHGFMGEVYSVIEGYTRQNGIQQGEVINTLKLLPEQAGRKNSEYIKIQSELKEISEGIQLMVKKNSKEELSFISSGHCVLKNGPERAINYTIKNGCQYARCMPVYHAHNRTVFNLHFVNEDMLEQAGCPMNKSRDIFPNRIPIVNLFYKNDRCALADGTEHEVR